MNIITIRLKGFLVGGSKYVHGYVDREDWYENRIYKQYLLFDKIPIFRKIIFREDVPNWAVLKRATLGFSEWKSSRPMLINASIERRIIKSFKINLT